MGDWKYIGPAQSGPFRSLEKFYIATIITICVQDIFILGEKQLGFLRRVWAYEISFFVRYLKLG